MQTLAHETTRPSFGRTDGSFLYACQREKIATQFTWEQMGLPSQPALINQQDNLTASGCGASQRPRRSGAGQWPSQRRSAEPGKALDSAQQRGGSRRVKDVTCSLLSLLLLHIMLLTPQAGAGAREERQQPKRPRTFPFQDREGKWHAAVPARKMPPPWLLGRGHLRCLVPSIFPVLSEVKSCKVNLEALRGRWWGGKGKEHKGIAFMMLEKAFSLDQLTIFSSFSSPYMVLPRQLFLPGSRPISESPCAPFATVNVAGYQTWLRQCLHFRLCVCWLSNSHIHFLTLVFNLFLSLKNKSF